MIRSTVRGGTHWSTCRIRGKSIRNGRSGLRPTLTPLRIKHSSSQGNWPPTMASKRSSEQFPGFDRVYRMHDPDKRGAFVASLGIEAKDAHGLLRGTLKPKAPIPVRWLMGRSTPSDFIWPSLVGPKIVNQR